MKNETKKQIFDVLEKGGMIEKDSNPLNLKLENNLWETIKIERVRKDVYRHTNRKLDASLNEIIADDIETRMLDWLRDQLGDLFYNYNLTAFGLKMRIRPSKKIPNEQLISDWESSFKTFSHTDKPRPVAKAEMCVWVYQQIKEAE